ncbi:hypothetical protein D3C81_1493150 [compost metagenome]
MAHHEFGFLRRQFCQRFSRLFRRTHRNQFFTRADRPPQAVADDKDLTCLEPTFIRRVQSLQNRTRQIGLRRAEFCQDFLIRHAARNDVEARLHALRSC